MAHTPGPWTAYCASDDGDNYIGATGDRIVAQNASEDDARLIAAAPDLLAALKEAAKYVEYRRRAHKDVQSGDGMPVETSWKEIIAKAEGK